MDNIKNQFKIQKPILNSWRIWKAVFALLALEIGTTISYGTITASMANTGFSVDKLTIMTGLTSVVSSIFGGAPLSPIVSVTAVADHPAAVAGCIHGYNGHYTSSFSYCLKSENLFL